MTLGFLEVILARLSSPINNTFFLRENNNDNNNSFQNIEHFQDPNEINRMTNIELLFPFLLTVLYCEVFLPMDLAGQELLLCMSVSVCVQTVQYTLLNSIFLI
jgi:hypothetical protein